VKPLLCLSPLVLLCPQSSRRPRELYGVRGGPRPQNLAGLGAPGTGILLPAPRCHAKDERSPFCCRSAAPGLSASFISRFDADSKRLNQFCIDMASALGV
jgi:hypothetical protein